MAKAPVREVCPALDRFGRIPGVKCRAIQVTPDAANVEPATA
jgi:hypothetical protein